MQETGYGLLPIHFAARDSASKSVEILLKHDPTAATKTKLPRLRHVPPSLPLHMACGAGLGLEAVQVLYDAYPEAIFIQAGNGNMRIDDGNDNGRTPLDIARIKRCLPIVKFLEAQLEYAQKANDTTSMMTLDNTWSYTATSCNERQGSSRIYQAVG